MPKPSPHRDIASVGRALTRSLTYEQIMTGSDAVRQMEAEIKIEERSPIEKNRDFQRLARRLFGFSIALVLGGGAACGIAHVGVIQALEQRGIPIDIIGGTSYGAYVGALYAKENNFWHMQTRVKQFAKRLRVWKFIGDATLPL